MTFIVAIQTKRFLRKPLVEMFEGNWKSAAEVRCIIAKYRPKAKILGIKEITVIKDWT